MSKDTSDYHYAVIGNGRTSALIDEQGTVVFCCMPDFDSGTVFAFLLDEEKGGQFGISVPGGQISRQNYERNTNLLVTRYESEDGIFEVIDFMPRYTADGRAGLASDVSPDLIRFFRLVEGRPKLCVTYDPKLEYGRFQTENHILGKGLIKSTTNGLRNDGHEVYESLYLYTDLPEQSVLDGSEISLTGDHYILLSYHDKVQLPNHERIELMLERTRSYWLLWAARTHLPKRYRKEVMRSALALKLLQFGPTGALLAATTTSLPETIGEERNWDYRFCWIRDGSMTVEILRKIGHPFMATRFIEWLLHTVPTKDDSIQIMYGLRGEKHLTEEVLGHFSGYLGSRPVRTGNAAYTQEQHDIYGVLLDIIYQDLLARSRTPESLDRIWTRVRSVARTVSQSWQQPDRGIWEIQGEKRHFVFSKVLCWVAIDRAMKIARLLDKDDWALAHKPLLDDIHTSVCTHGWSQGVGAFVQSYGSQDLDASNLLMAPYGFISPKDKRYIATVEATQKRLCCNGLMYRYRNEDDFGAPQSAFTVCSFWLVKSLALIGRRGEARKLYEELLAAANRHGLYGEDLDFKTRRHLGNFPQAYSHLALIDCALELSDDKEETDFIQA